MRRSLITLSIALTMFVGVTAPAYAANLPLLDPNFSIVPAQCTACPCGFGGILQLIQNLVNAGVAIGVFAMVLIIAYAGASFMLNPTNPEARSKARSMLINVVVGMVILLAAWLIVDFIMKTLYNKDSQYGPWNSILAPMAGDTGCIQQTTPHAISGGIGGAANYVANGSQTNGGGTGGPAGPLPTGTGACDISTVAAGAAAGGYRLTSTQAAELACIARYESTCGTARGPYNLNYSWNKANTDGKASTAAGAFQVLLSTNSACYDNPACEQAAGTPGASLNCKSGFTSQGFPIPGSATVQKCTQAAGNTNCSAAAAACQLQHQSFSSMYAADSHMSSCQT